MEVTQEAWDSLSDFFGVSHTPVPTEFGECIPLPSGWGGKTPGTGGGHFGWNPSKETRERMSIAQKKRFAKSPHPSKGHKRKFKPRDGTRRMKVSLKDREVIRKRLSKGEKAKDIHKDYQQVTLQSFYNICAKLK